MNQKLQPKIIPSGLYFATREEAIAFGFSRFSAEEIQIYNRVSANGLTPEQEEVSSPNSIFTLFSRGNCSYRGCIK